MIDPHSKQPATKSSATGVPVNINTDPTDSTGLSLASAPRGIFHRKHFLLNSTAVMQTRLKVGPFTISVTGDKRGLKIDGEGLKLFVTPPGCPLVVTFKGAAGSVDKAFSEANIQMEAGRTAEGKIQVAFYREDRLPIARLIGEQSKKGIKIEVLAPFGHWREVTGLVELVEGNL